MLGSVLQNQRYDFFLHKCVDIIINYINVLNLLQFGGPLAIALAV